MAEPFLSEIRMMSFNFAPKGWAMCNGQLLPINQNQALFSLLGTTYGGDGRISFGLPDLRGLAPIHMGSGHTLGERGGEQAHTLGSQESGHGHDALVNTSPASKASPVGNVWASGPAAVYGDNVSAAMTPPAVTSVGGGQPHQNMQPYLTSPSALPCRASSRPRPSREGTSDGRSIRRRDSHLPVQLRAEGLGVLRRAAAAAFAEHGALLAARHHVRWRREDRTSRCRTCRATRRCTRARARGCRCTILARPVARRR